MRQAMDLGPGKSVIHVTYLFHKAFIFNEG